LSNLFSLNQFEMDISKKLKSILDQIPSKVKLVAVSKTKPIETIMEAYNVDYRIFGENKVQELASKYEKMPKDIEWHMIGHLQSNKVKYIAPFVNLIHGVDSFKLLKEINKQGLKNDRIIRCLLQFHIAEEDTKFGFDLSEVIEILKSSEFKNLNNILVAGVMGMATFTDNMSQVRKEFRQLKSNFDILKSDYFTDREEFKEISMGMSSDYKIAIEEGSTIVRIGSEVFGLRNVH
jgi:PLP dependent protein